MMRGSASICASCTIGDIICQGLQISNARNARKKAPTFDLWRTASFATSGLLVMGPLSYSILTVCTKVVPGSSTAAIVGRVGLITALEPARLATFIGAHSLISGRSMQEARHKVECETIPTYLRSCLVWPPFLFVAFRFLRHENRIPLMASIGCVWNTYMSYVTSRQANR